MKKAGKAFEIIYVPGDKTLSQFESSVSQMPWPSIPVFAEEGMKLMTYGLRMNLFQVPGRNLNFAFNRRMVLV